MKKTSQKINKNDIHIRKALKEDASALIDYVKIIADETEFLTFDSSEWNKTIKEEERIIEEHNSSNNQIFSLAKVDDKIVGILKIQSSKKKRLEHSGELDISVLKDYWSQGIGNALMTHNIIWAKKTGIIKKLNLVVSVNNKKAIGLYMKNGFIIEGMIRRDMKLNDSFQDAYQMGLLID